MMWLHESDEGVPTRHNVRHPWQAYRVCVILTGMSDRFFAAARAYRRAKAAYERSQEDLVPAMFEAAEGGLPQVEIVKATGLTREHVRRLVKAERERRAGGSTEPVASES